MAQESSHLIRPSSLSPYAYDLPVHELGHPVRAHDSVNMKDIAPSIMLFVPSVEGISHNEGELTDDTDISAGTDLLTEVVHRLMSGALD
ncbi:hypothetical protein [Streptomyces phaeochromogenes]